MIQEQLAADIGTTVKYVFLPIYGVTGDVMTVKFVKYTRTARVRGTRGVLFFLCHLSSVTCHPVIGPSGKPLPLK